MNTPTDFTAEHPEHAEQITLAAEWLKAAQRVAVLTGAGVSADSGIPTFREAQTGIWEIYQPQDLASPQAYAANPDLVWEWYASRYRTVSAAQPNEAHHLLTELERRKAGGFFLATQNVDGLHVRAGSGKHGGGYVELHGNLATARDEVTGQVHPLPEAETLTTPPLSPAGHRMRPNVVWFGEQLPPQALAQAEAAFSAAEVALIVGTSSVVHPAAGLAELTLWQGGKVVEINPVATELTSRASLSLRAGASEGLRQLLQGW